MLAHLRSAVGSEGDSLSARRGHSLGNKPRARATVGQASTGSAATGREKQSTAGGAEGTIRGYRILDVPHGRLPVVSMVPVPAR